VEIVDGRPHIHAVMAVQGDRAIAGHLHKAQLDTTFARAYVIPFEQHVAVPADEQIEFGQVPDEPAGRGRINDTRVAAPPSSATSTPQ
jgi:uncharacterized protein